MSPGDWALLDLFGTNRDPRIWTEPEAFRPGRFLDRQPDPFQLIPQGGGDHCTGHRCPGEWITLALARRAARRRPAAMTYRVRNQYLTERMNRCPTLPKSRFIMTNIRAAN